MSDSLLSVVLIFAELGGVLLLVLILWVLYYLSGNKKEGKTTQDLIKHIKTILPVHRDNLKNHFKNNIELEQNKTDFNVNSLMDDEKKIYERLINVSISKDTGLLKLTINDINTLINDYVQMLTLKGKELSNDDRDSRGLILRKENEALRLEVTSLETRLKVSNDTIENMMSEFSSMYEGGKKAGKQRLKNEMYQLKQAFNTEETKIKSELNELNESKDD